MAKTTSFKKVNAIIKNFAKKLQEEDLIPISELFLFGSYAKNKQKSKSDVDVCIVSPKFRDRISASSFLNQKFYRECYPNNTNLSFDIVGYPYKDFTADSPFVWEIRTTGKKINV